MTNEQILEVLRSWYLIEMLSPNGVRLEKKMLSKHTLLKAEYQASDLPALPWEMKQQELIVVPEPLTDGEREDDVEERDGDDDEYEEGYIFYLGIVSLSDAYKAIRRALDTDDSFTDRERRASDYCALASLRLTLEGRPVETSLTISTLPWYLGRIKALGLGKVLTEPVGGEFHNFATTFAQTAFADSGPLLQAADLAKLAEAVVKACDAAEIPWAYAFAGKREKFDPNEPPGLLNSFFHEDVADAVGLLRDRRLPSVVAALFEEAPRRIDVYRNDVERSSAMRRDALPRAGWPTNAGHLALMQQAALIAANSPDARCIASVNGPPGTGKTTLLRSFVAENVVKRADKLASFEDPSHVWTLMRAATEKEVAIYAPSPQVTGFEMLVASANNGAIENITKDVPLESSVPGFEPVLAEMDHFASVALNVANFRRKSGQSILKPWGLISAALGNKKKRTEFIDPLLNEAKTDVTQGVETLPGFVAGTQCESWDEARSAFKSANGLLRKRLSELVEPDASWEALSHEEQQKCAPFIDDRTYALQIDVFLKALALHRVFIQKTWSQMSSNLTAWAKLALRPISTDLTGDEATALWRTFFLVCPVASTTFASARRMLAGINWSSLGWALIDEAGQATPQAAIGVLLRCKRAMIVGDPLQLEPIVTLSPSIVRLIRETYGADERFISSSENGESLQTLADTCSVHGTLRPTEMPDGSKRSQWIGVPLVVHRRCLEPMFSICNRIYGGDNGGDNHGDLIFAVKEPKRLSERHPLGESAWIDEQSSSRPHAVDEQIELAKEMILTLFSYYRKRYQEIDRTLSPSLSREAREEEVRPWLEPSVSVIAPFRQIEEDLQSRLSEYKGMETWARKRVGTIHKFQGKESDAVILVLGLDRRNKRASAFATNKPNMMNVAVTRAKHRHYVVGNSAVWGDAPYFRDIYQELKGREALTTCTAFQAAMRAAVPFDPLHVPLMKQKRSRRSKQHAAF